MPLSHKPLPTLQMKFTSAAVVLSAVAISASAASPPHSVGMDLCCATNQVRAKHGLPAFKWSPKLDQMASQHSSYMRSQQRTVHSGAPGSNTETLADRLKSVNFKWHTAAENIASNYVDGVTSVNDAWVNSPGHFKNMVSKDNTVCGGAVSNPGAYYTIDYASPWNEADNKNFYDLICQGDKALGVRGGDSNPTGHDAKPPTPQQPKPQPPKQEPQPQPQPQQPNKPAPQQPNKPQPPTGHHGNQPAVPEESKPANPAGGSQPPAPSAGKGKCKRVPKGSIAAGKCKPCKKCGQKPARR